MEDENQTEESEIETTDRVLEVAFIELQNNLDKDCSWGMDSGATKHVTGSKQCLNFIENMENKNKSLTTVGGEKYKIEGIGDGYLCIREGQIKLDDVFYIPSLEQNLMSVGTLTDKGNMVVFMKDKCFVLNNSHDRLIIGSCSRDNTNGLYRMGEHTIYDVNNKTHKEKMSLWHRKYGHLSYSGLRHLYLKHRVANLSKIDFIKDTYHDCLDGCQKRESFSIKSTSRAQHVLELVHSDVVGPLPKASLSGSRYYVIFTNDHSRKSWLYFLKAKGQVFEKFRIFRERTEKEIGKELKILRTDKGGDFLSK